MSEDTLFENEKWLHDARELWDREADSFDDQPDHGLRDPAVRNAWTDFLRSALPTPPAALLDIGCGTGSLSLVLAKLGYEVTGIDLSPAMIARAEAKAISAGSSIQFQVMDAAFPQLQAQHFDTIVCRHLLWALPHIDQVLQRWAGLLKPGGRFVLVEGFWHTGAGLHAQEIVDTLPASLTQITVEDLHDRSILWGGEVHDERYAIIARF